MKSLCVKLGPLELKNPVLTASGTFGFGYEYADIVPPEKLGAVVVKGISLHPVEGNPTPRIVEVSCGILNAIGLQNPGVESFISEDKYLPFLKKHNADVIVNIWGTSIEDYAAVASILNKEAGVIKALEINVSCPNIKLGGISFGKDPGLLREVVAAVRETTELPLITKLSPNVTDITTLANVAIEAGSDIISAINTFPAMSIDVKTRRPRLANVSGGLSGPAIKPIGVKMVYDLFKSLKVPIIGMGGIMSGEDAMEFMLAGAGAIAVGTGMFINPLLPLDIINFMSAYISENNLGNISQIVGQVNLS